MTQILIWVILAAVWIWWDLRIQQQVRRQTEAAITELYQTNLRTAQAILRLQQMLDQLDDAGTSRRPPEV